MFDHKAIKLYFISFLFLWRLYGPILLSNTSKYSDLYVESEIGKKLVLKNKIPYSCTTYNNNDVKIAWLASKCTVGKGVDLAGRVCHQWGYTV